ncbi:MAG: HAD family phosphatase [Clostridiales bacterium]|jgi:HAD superfamily hydrolase (TIGR01509 family)|nr:HAD family phosphatase [Clostridiales bacterium]
MTKDFCGAIFDLDGTLTDSMPVWESAGANYLKTKNIEANSDIVDKMRSITLMESSALISEEYGLDESAEEIFKGINKVIEHDFFHTIALKKGVVKILDLFKRRGVKMCVATATERRLAEAVLKRNGILDYFNAVLTCNELNTGKKYSPKIFLEALDVLGTEKHNTYVFEDALHAVITAKRAGFNVVAVYDDSAKDFKEEIKNTADLFIRSWHDYYRIIKGEI